jgi:hypothetical protein
MLGARGSPSSFAPPQLAACDVWAPPTRVPGHRAAPGDWREGELPGTDRPERLSRGDGRRPGESEKGTGDGVRSRGGSHGQATADDEQELNSS